MKSEHKHAPSFMETLISNVMLTGVILSATLVFIGGALYLWHHANVTENYSIFLMESTHFTSLRQIIQTAWQGSERSMIQLGVLLLIYLQLVRLFLSACLFLFKKEWVYVAFSIFIFGFLIYSLTASF